MTVRHPPVAEGFTQADKVIALVRSSDALSATVTMPVVPLKATALPYLPVVLQVAPALSVPVFNWPEASAVVVPVPSSKEYAAMRPAGTAGPELLIVIFTGAETVELLAPSRATAVMTWVPFVALFVSHEIEYGAVVSSAAIATPSRRNVTPATITLSEAFACSVNVPEIVDPSARPTIETVGAT